jgi:hypothetical protein
VVVARALMACGAVLTVGEMAFYGLAMLDVRHDAIAL